MKLCLHKRQKESVLTYVLFLKFDMRGFSFFKKTPRIVLFICIGTYYILWLEVSDSIQLSNLGQLCLYYIESITACLE